MKCSSGRSAEDFFPPTSVLSCVSGLPWPLALTVTNIPWEKLSARKEVMLILVIWQLQVISQQLWQSGWHHQARHAYTIQAWYKQGQDCSSPQNCVICRGGWKGPFLQSPASLPRRPATHSLRLAGCCWREIQIPESTLTIPWTTITWRQIYYVFDTQVCHQPCRRERKEGSILAETKENATPYFARNSNLTILSLESYIKSCWGWSCSLKNSKATQLCYILFENTEVCK